MSMIDSYDDLSLNEKEDQLGDNSKTNDTIKLYIRRWFILSAFSLIIILNVFNLTEYFDVEDTFVDFYSRNRPLHWLKKYETAYFVTLTNLTCYIAFLFPAMILLHLKGIWFSCMIGIFLTIFGSWIKCASVKVDFFVILVSGQLICAIAQPFIQNPLVRLSSLWFGQKETATATSVCKIFF